MTDNSTRNENKTGGGSTAQTFDSPSEEIDDLHKLLDFEQNIWIKLAETLVHHVSSTSTKKRQREDEGNFEEELVPVESIGMSITEIHVFSLR